MRTAFIILLLTAFTMSYSQLYRYRVDAYAITDKDGEYGEWIDMENTMVIRWDITKGTIKINNQFNDSFALIGEGAFTDDLKKKKFGEYSVYTSEAIDNEGRWCSVRVVMWTDLKVIHFGFHYPAFAYMYEALLID